MHVHIIDTSILCNILDLPGIDFITKGEATGSDSANGSWCG